jgi:hypothetical protein
MIQSRYYRDRLTVETAVSERRATSVANPTHAAGLVGSSTGVGVRIADVGSALSAAAVWAAMVSVVHGDP